MFKIVNYLLTKSKGISFINSNYISSGITSLSFILEELGFFLHVLKYQVKIYLYYQRLKNPTNTQNVMFLKKVN